MYISVTALVAVFWGFVVARNGCRQCTGTHSIRFNGYANELQATSFLHATLGSCATGNDLESLVILATECTLPCIEAQYSPTKRKCLKYGPLACKAWEFDLTVWRYCGNGGAVSVTKGNHNIDTWYVEEDTLQLTCVKSVECRGTCHCNQCGC